MPVAVARDEAVHVVGERWPSFVPSEPMTEEQAESVRRIRDRIAVDPEWAARVVGARNCLVAGNPRAAAVLRDVLS